MALEMLVSKRRKGLIMVLGIVLAGTLLSASLPGGIKEMPVQQTGVGKVRAPEFPTDLEWLNTDRPLTLAELRGKVVLLDFWTYCCINCMHIIPELTKLEEKWHEELVVIGVHSAKFETEQDTRNIRQAILRYDVAHPVVNDKDFRVWRSYAVRAWPTLVLIDPAGRIVGQQSGETTFERFGPVIERVVKAAEEEGTLVRGPLTLTTEKSRAVSSLLRFPGKVLADAAGQRLFIADSTHNRVLVCTIDGRIEQIIGSGEDGFLDGSFETARLRKPQGMAVDGDTLYIADTENHSLRVADLKSQQVTTLAGRGTKPIGYNRPGKGYEVALHSPWDVVQYQGQLIVANAGSHQLWTVDPQTGAAAPFVGSGREALIDGSTQLTGNQAETAMAQPSGLALDGDTLWIADSEISALRELDLAEMQLTTRIGQGLFDFGDVDGDRGKARLQHALGVAVLDGAVYVADTYNNRIKKFDPTSGEIHAYAGTGQPGLTDGPLATAQFDEPGGLSTANGKLYVADTNNQAIRVIDPTAGTVTTLNLSEVDMAAPPMADRALVELAAMTSGEGEGELVLDLKLPAGLKLNPGAPLTIKLAEGGPVKLQAGSRTRIADPSLPLHLPATFTAGSGAVTITADLYACTTSGTGACFFESVALTMPVTVTAGQAPSLTVSYALPALEMP